MRLAMSDRLSAAGHSTFAISRASIFGGIDDGQQHAGVGAATTEIAAETGPDLFEGGVGMLAHERGAGDDKAGRAKAALLGVVVHKGLLHLVHPVRRAQPFDSRYFAAFGFDGEHRARIDRTP